ncbi:unnamed protein product [Larinioides sclopetarius]|uniref:Uncharacterized protein n=1 Tax=Larinioides sclopetarius TaxID=280406 RepID=A0AAV2AZR6_9ARAC
MTTSALIDSPPEQSVSAIVPKEDVEQRRQNWFHSCFEWIRGCYSSCCSGFRSLPSSLRVFLGRGLSLLRSSSILRQGNSGVVLLPEKVSPCPPYFENPFYNEVVNTEKPPQADADSLANLETECDFIPIMNCVLQMSDDSKFSIE